MLPSSLTTEQFRQYPPEARALAVANLDLFRQMPLGLLPSLLQELIEYDHKFPAERASLNGELTYLGGLARTQRTALFADFASLKIPAELDKPDWVNQPLAYTEAFSAHLWSTHQMDAFQRAAAAYGGHLQAAVPAPKPVMPRLGIAIIGRGVSAYDKPLFTQLRPHGTYFSNVQPADGVSKLLAAIKARAASHPEPYAHWYVDGGELSSGTEALTCVSYAGLSPARNALLNEIQREAGRPGAGPESLRNYIAHLQPERLGLAGDSVLDRFSMKLLTEGSGTQIFSTTFAQWTAREALRRAGAVSLLVRFAPRQRQRPMNELLSNGAREVELDPVGSLVDANMAAYYQWINQQRLPGYEESAFLVWFEGQRQALAIGPALARGAASSSSVDLGSLLALATGNPKGT